jgi:hypothetical protein
VRDDATEALLLPALQGLAACRIPAELPVRGRSMRPALRHGDRLRLLPTPVERVPIGAVVVWHSAMGVITHRLLARWRGAEGWRVFTKGDACWRLDPPQIAGEALAWAVAVQRGGRLYRLDGGWRRWGGAGRAAASLLTGLAVEAWDRLRRSRWR